MGTLKKRASLELSNDWHDPIIAEVRQAREEVGREMKKDPEGYYKNALKNAKKLGFKIAKLKPVKPKQ